MDEHIVSRLCHRENFSRAAHSIIVYQRKAVDRRQPLASFEAVKLDDKRTSDHVSSEFAHQPRRRIRSTAGREQVVGNQHPRSVYDPVLMYLQGRAAVLEIVGLIEEMKWQLDRLACNRQT